MTGPSTRQSVRYIAAAGAALLFALLSAVGCGSTRTDGAGGSKSGLAMPAPDSSGGMALNEALDRRRSRRSFTSSGITDEQLSQLLWAAQGITDRKKGFRTAPSAGALYPLEIYLLRKSVLQRYDPTTHSLQPFTRDIDTDELATAAEGQSFVAGAPVVFVVTGDFEKTRIKYGDRAERYVYMEAGHAAQNLLLEATALLLGAVPVGAFDDARVKRILKLPEGWDPIYLIPVGHPAD